jgi:hypothetical protein
MPKKEIIKCLIQTMITSRCNIQTHWKKKNWRIYEKSLAKPQDFFKKKNTTISLHKNQEQNTQTHFHSIMPQAGEHKAESSSRIIRRIKLSLISMQSIIEKMSHEKRNYERD